MTDESPLRLASRLQGVESERHVGVLVVDERADDARRETVRLVAQLLSRLVELALNLRRWHVVAELQESNGQARARERLRAVVPAELLKPLLQSFRDLILHLLRCRARPRGDYGHRLHGECRVLGTSQPEEGDDPRDGDEEDREKSDGALTNRERGEIESAHGLPAPVGAASRPEGSAASRTSWPSCSACAPSDTTRSPCFRPSLTLTLSSSMRFKVWAHFRWMWENAT